MKIHEYQGKELFRRYGIPVPIGEAAMSVDEAIAAVPKVQKASGVEVVVVKAQIHAGGRGKGGGVKVAKSREEAEKAVRAIFGMNLVTPQTGPEGKKVQRLLVEQGLAIEKEYYLGVTLDRAAGRVTIMASSEGGMDIEEVAASHPEKIRRAALHPALGYQEHQGRELGFGLGLGGKQVAQFAKILGALCRMYEEMDCSLVEVNPLITTKDGKVLALDAKVNFDDNAVDRHPELGDWRDLSEEDPAEIEAKQFDLSYIALDGNIGCMVNGAGLAMSTMDIIQHYGMTRAIRVRDDEAMGSASGRGCGPLGLRCAVGSHPAAPAGAHGLRGRRRRRQRQLLLRPGGRLRRRGGLRLQPRRRPGRHHDCRRGRRRAADRAVPRRRR